MYQTIRGKKFMFMKKPSKTLAFYYKEICLYTNITDFVVAMNTFVQEGCNHSGNFITVRISWRTQQSGIYFPKERPGLVFFSMDLGQISGSFVDKNFGVLVKKNNLANKILLTTSSASTLS